MTKDNRKVRRRKKNRMRALLVALLVFYLSVKMISSIYSSSIKTSIVEMGRIEITEETQGIIIKDEKVYKSDYNGRIKYLKDEGEKVGIGTKIAEILVNDKHSDLKQELEEINSKLEQLKDGNVSKEIFKGDIEKNQEYIEDTISKLRESIVNSDYINMEKLVEQLNSRIDFQRKIIGQDGYVGYTIENLNKRKNEILDQIKDLEKSYYSNDTGLISFQLDGLEEIFTCNNLLEFTPDDFKIIEKRVINLKDKDIVNIDDPVFKICDNFKWFLIAKLDKSSLDSLKEGKDVYIRFNNLNEDIEANIRKINMVDDEALLVFEFDEYLYKFINERYVDIQVLKKQYEGLKIPKTAIVKKNGIKGVYVKEIGNIVKFRPIKIIGENDEYAIVYEGEKLNINNRGKIEVKYGDKIEKQYTIALFDKIILNGNKVNEGNIID